MAALRVHLAVLGQLMRQIGIIGEAATYPLEFTTDRTRRSAKALVTSVFDAFRLCPGFAGARILRCDELYFS